ncbi:MAG: gliding motility-associated C-terminal domain-containing protein [Bacteroidetes bacterium]|nr:gliding motility-associated C-terminal domain-containing protein [Bacteroidota bacterium]
MEDGKEHTICITYTPSTTVLLVTIDGVTKMNFNMGAAGLSLQSYFGAGGLNISWSCAKFGASSPITVSKGASISDNAGAVIGLPNPSVADHSICQGDPFPNFNVVALSGGPFTTIQWSGLGTGAGSTTPSSAAGNYIVDVTNAAGCSAKDTGVLIVNTLPTPTIANKTICAGDPAVTFDAGAGYSAYSWSGNGTGTLQTTSGTTIGNYICQVTDANGCKASATGVLSIGSATAPVLSDKTICAGDPAATFDAGPGYATYVWSANGAGSAQTTTGTTAGNYTVTVTTAGGCTASATAVLTVNALPTPVIANKTICVGDPAATFDAGLYSSYLWSANGAGNSQTTVGSIAGNYTCQVTDAKGCKAFATGVLTINVLPIVALGTDQTICPSGSATLNAGGPFASYKWLPGNESTSAITVNTAGTYTVAVTDVNGCKNSDAVDVFVNSNLAIDLGLDQTICAGDDFTFTANYAAAGVTYVWTGTGGYSNNTQAVTVNTSGTYNVHVEDALGCMGDDEVVLTVALAPTPSLASATRCDGDAAAFDAGNFSSYVWTGPNAFSATSNPIVVSQAGIYNVTVTDANGCVGTASATLTVNAPPVVNLGNNFTGCAGASATFDAQNPGSTYLWNNGMQTQSISPLVSGTYSVIVTDVNGCEGSGSVVATINEFPVLDLGDTIHLCEGDSKKITANVFPSSSVITWNTSEVGESIFVNTTGKILASANSNGCVTKDSLEVLVHEQPKVFGIPDSTVCFVNLPSGFSIDARTLAAQYNWSDGQSGQTITVRTDGEYNVELVSDYGCVSRDTLIITEDCPSSIFAPTAFTPNEDGLNDVFYVKGENIYDFELFVFDRWGEVIFHSTDMNTGWNGKRNNDMRNAQVDVYVWKINYKYWSDWKHDGDMREEVGRVTLIK